MLINYEIKYEKSYVLVIRVSGIVRFDLNTDSYANFVKKIDTKAITFYLINSPFAQRTIKKFNDLVSLMLLTVRLETIFFKRNCSRRN